MTRDEEFYLIQESPNELSHEHIVPRAPSTSEVDRARQVVAERSHSVPEARELLEMIGILDPHAVQFRTEG